MELKQYWSIIRARWWLVVLIGGAVFGVSLITTPRTMASHTASARLAIRPEEEPRVGSYYKYDEYYAYLAAEYLNDDLADVVAGTAFRDDVLERARRQYERKLAGAFDLKKEHRVVVLSATSSTPEDALTLCQIAVNVLTDPDAPYLAAISSQNPQVSIVDTPTLVGATAAGRMGLDIAVRTLLGILVGLALIFLLDYLDDTVRGAGEVREQLGLDVLGEIPAESKALRSASATAKASGG